MNKEKENEIYYDAERMEQLNQERLEGLRELTDELIQEAVLGPEFEGLEDALFDSPEDADEYGHGRSQAERDMDRLNFDAHLEEFIAKVKYGVAEKPICLVYTDEPYDLAAARLETAYYGRTK